MARLPPESRGSRGADATVRALRVVPGSPTWPAVLSEIDEPPSSLWLRGRPEVLAAPRRVAVIGSRAPTPYGAAQAARFAGRLAEEGVVVVSGLARGVDQAAHAAALDAGGGTVAVLGSGVDRPWPDGELTRRLACEGLLLSEHAPGEAPRRHHFPLRNRIISGLCAAVLVVEAARRSGTLITCRWALDQGRDVYALPGRVDHPMARGCHRLIREGAGLVETPEELLEELGWRSRVREEGEAAGTPATPLERALVGETLDAGELAARLGLPVGQVLVQLVRLELEGRVVRGPGGLYRLA